MKESDLSNKKKDYAQGAIVRMKLENFVTYDSLEFSPGANLNVIIGPNGTGKSSIVCAICLGMAGKPTVLGRATTIADFVKYGKSKATIEIELNNEKGTNYTIRRFIFKDNKSEWFLNDRSVKLKDIEELVQSLNIQVQNLCQFLPQEKVSEFARLNKFELLESTEKAVGGIELFEKHQELKEHAQKSREYDRDVVNIEMELKREQAINARLESQVSSFKEKKKFEESIQWLKKKRALLTYSKKKEEYEGLKKEKEMISREIHKVSKELEPTENQRAKAEADLKRHKDLTSAKTREIGNKMAVGAGLSNKLNELTEKMNEAKQDYSMRENEVKSRQATLTKLATELEHYKTQYESAKEDLPDLLQSEAELRRQEEGLVQEMGKYDMKRFESTTAINKLKGDIDDVQKQLAKINSERENRMRKLREANGLQSTYRAVQWLEANRGMFEGEVYEPFFLRMNIKRPELAKYVEASINFRDLCSMFLFEKSSDMHLFQTEVRDKQQLPINCGLVPDKPSNSYNSPCPISDIKKYGFQTYVHELIDAPEAIIRFLCLNHQIHTLPIGSEYTQKNLSAIMPHIPNFKRIYTNTHSYSFTKSRYSGKTSSASSEVTESYWLNSSVDASQIRDLEKTKARNIEELALHQNSHKINTEKKEEIKKQIDQIKVALGKLREQKQYVDNMKHKYQLNLTKYQRLEADKINILADAEAKARTVCDQAKKRVKLFADYVASAESLLLLNKDKLQATYNQSKCHSEVRKLDAELRDKLVRKQELESQIAGMEDRLKNGKEEANRALETASRMIDVDLRKNQIPTEIKLKFQEFPEKLEDIEGEIHKCEAISSCSHDVDARVVEEYENREKTIETLLKQYEKKKQKLENQRQNYEDLKKNWIEQVDDMINGINKNFTLLFRQLKCAGEVMLEIPDDSEEFSKYGVKIMVSYRSNEALQELTNWQQSGGEKSVATMMYMIALQEMTKCPFRVVDEINQGMDPVNERKVFDIIVQNSCSKLFAQYFLLTPKLLPDLSFDERTNVICVFNGPKNMPHNEYSLNRFIELRRSQDQRA